MIGLYDQQGVLRFAGCDIAECLDYAELFDLAPEIYSLQPLMALADDITVSQIPALT